MQHGIDAERYGPQGEAMAHQVKTCVHCGFCLPVCPTYKDLGQEMDSPRGRILLMKEMLEGNLEMEEGLPYVDKCLGCMACVTACPSGVEYGELLTPFRALARDRVKGTLLDRLTRLSFRLLLPFPRRFRAAAYLGRLARPFTGMLPERMASMLELLPRRLPASPPLPSVYPAQGRRRARVALLSGCVQQVLSPSINWATLRVLARNGVEVIVPAEQGCCGALALHNGDAEQARRLAAHNFEALPDDVDAIITNAAGCGSGIKEYPLLFRSHGLEEEARRFSARVRDVSVFLDELGLERDPPPLPAAMKVAYHDACHLAHAQGIRSAPRKLLKRIPNLTLMELMDGETCCGSAGTYNLEQPEIANRLGANKTDVIERLQPDAVAAGNVGCLMQIESHLKRRNSPLPVLHTVELLDRAYESA